jgi:hypothetical protein
MIDQRNHRWLFAWRDYLLASLDDESCKTRDYYVQVEQILTSTRKNADHIPSELIKDLEHRLDRTAVNFSRIRSVQEQVQKMNAAELSMLFAKAGNLNWPAAKDGTSWEQ